MALRQHLVDDAVAAAGAIVRLVLQFFLALVGRVEERFRLGCVPLRIRVYSATGLDMGHLLLVGCPKFAHARARTNSSTSSCEGTLPPQRLRNSTGRAPFNARRTSSTIWPLLISTTTNDVRAPGESLEVATSGRDRA